MKSQYKTLNKVHKYEEREKENENTLIDQRDHKTYTQQKGGYLHVYLTNKSRSAMMSSHRTRGIEVTTVVKATTTGVEVVFGCTTRENRGIVENRGGCLLPLILAQAPASRAIAAILFPYMVILCALRIYSLICHVNGNLKHG